MAGPQKQAPDGVSAIPLGGYVKMRGDDDC